MNEVIVTKRAPIAFAADTYGSIAATLLKQTKRQAVRLSPCATRTELCWASFFSNSSQIALRFLRQTEEPIDREWWRSRLSKLPRAARE